MTRAPKDLEKVAKEITDAADSWKKVKPNLNSPLKSTMEKLYTGGDKGFLHSSKPISLPDGRCTFPMGYGLDDSLLKKVISPKYLEETVKYSGYVIQGSELQGHTIGQMKKEFPYIRWIAYLKGYPGLKGYKKKTKIANNVKLDITTYFWVEGPKSHINKLKRKNQH